MGWGVPYPSNPDWNEPERELPECPVCGKKAETFYVSANYEVVGCEYCITKIDADEMEEDR